MDLDTDAVLKAAGTKWNFLPFRPGLVGGHCISVDPYYLTHKAEALGYHPQVILAGRRINDGMGSYVAGQMIKVMLKHRIQISGARVLILGLAFKENCPDLRNTRVIDVVRELQDYGIGVTIYDPWVDPTEARAQYGLDLILEIEPNTYDGIIIAVGHQCFVDSGAATIRAGGRERHVLYDLKGVLAPGESDKRL
jgi:UDP-N-acetyl-D-galactosamine dehydrogenase